MKHVLAICTAFCLLPTLIWAQEDAKNYWPQWRGPSGTGAAVQGNPPIEWSANQNMRWKIELPGTGFATPVIWGDHIFVSVATSQPAQTRPQGQSGRGSGQVRGSGSRGGSGSGRGSGSRRGGRQRGIEPTLTKYQVLALDRKTGKVIWQHIAKEEIPHQGHRADGSAASPSAVTDGEHLIASFGSRGFYCYDMDGNLKWEKDLGDMDIQGPFGEGSSPALHGNTVIINWDHQGQSFITALDKRTGKELWKTPRDERTTWTTPLIVEVNGKAQAIVAAAITRAYDLETGEEIWHCEGLVGGPIPTPVYKDGIVYVTSTSRGQGVLMAIHVAKAKGNIAFTDVVAWWTEEDTPHIPSPLVMGDQIYMLKNRNGILSSLNAKTGERLYGPQRLEGIQGMYSSPVGVKDRFYLASQDGAVLVVKHGPQFEVLAINTLDDSFNASPVIVDNELYLRGQRHLYCIASD